MTVIGDPINKIRRDYYPARDHGGPRACNSKTIKWVCLHDPEGLSAEGTGHTFDANDGRIGSAHIGTDDNSAQLYLPDGVIAWGAVGANTNGLHIEISGFARYSTAEWLKHESGLQRAAYWVRQWCNKYKVPVKYITAPGLKQGQRGITTHHQVETAWPSTGHYDPGSGFPIAHFIDLVKTGGKEEVTEDQVKQMVDNSFNAFDNGVDLWVAGAPRPPDDRKELQTGYDAASKIAAKIAQGG